MGVVNTGNFSKAMLPGISQWYGIDYKAFPKYTDKMFDVVKSEKLYEEIVGAVGPGLFLEKTEGDGVKFDYAQQGVINLVYNKTWALGLQFTQEVLEDNQYSQLAILSKEAGRYLAKSAAKTQETLSGNFYVNMFTTLHGDGVYQISASHPMVKGGTFSNTPAVACDLSEVALEQAIIDIRRLTDDAGTRINLIAESIIVAPENEFEIGRILQSVLQSDSANNNLNILKASGSFPKGVTVNPYLTSGKQWFIRTDIQEGKGLVCFNRLDAEPADDNSFDTGNMKVKCRFRRSYLLGDPRAVYASPGR